MSLHGVLAAALTPLTNEGESLDEDAVDPYVDFLAQAGLDGILALGTTGEGFLLHPDQRRRAAQLFVEAGRERESLSVAVHVGAQSTWDTVELAAHAADVGADAVAVIAPPYFALDDRAILRHLAAAARACEPTPFYVYEFEPRSGYAISVDVVRALRDEAPNLAGLKVSDKPWSAVAPYLIEGLDVFVGAEELLLEGLAAGAAGAVSGLASVFPDVVVDLVRGRGQEAHDRAVALRRGLERFPFHAAAKRAIAHRGIPMPGHVRAPLRGLTEDERKELDEWLESL
ncbi:MAG: dihydrodipicolinate synthase family protein [Thermoleophilia bacterium]